jgi:prepilin-type processing-associated H-X9-DG protein
VTPFQDERGVPGPIQSSFAAWGIYQSGPRHDGDKTYVMNANGPAGSYGLNGYMLHAVQTYGEGIPASEGWPDLESIPEPDRVPLFLDALRFDLWPRATDTPPADEPAFWNTPRYMGQCCINRHNGAVNCLFVDGSVRKAGLKELWTLKWSRSFNTAGPWTTAGGVRPECWPPWMRDFKDY